MQEAKALANRLKLGSSSPSASRSRSSTAASRATTGRWPTTRPTAQAICLSSDYHKQQAGRSPQEPLPYDWDALTKRAAE